MTLNFESCPWRLSFKKGSPAIDTKTESGYVGAIPFGYANVPGLTYSGMVLADYCNELQYQPVDIADKHYNLRWEYISRNGWFNDGIYGPDIRHFKGGDKALAGVEWRTKHYPSTQGGTAIGFYADGSHARKTAVKGILIARKSVTLNFLHSFNSKLKEDQIPPDAVFNYVVHYDDGTSVAIPIHYNQAVAGYIQKELSAPNDARIAWHIEDRWQGTKYYVLYSYEWQNPNPEKTIATIDIISSEAGKKNSYGSPIIFAISTGHLPPMGPRASRVE